MLTAIAIVLGVAMVTGTYVLTDSIKGAFDGIFTEIYRGHGRDDHRASRRSTSRARTARPRRRSTSRCSPRCATLPDVAGAVGGVGGEAHLIGKNGKVIVFGGAPNLGFSVDPDPGPQFNSLTLAEGAWPGANEVVVDKATAGKKDLEVGETIGVQAEGPRGSCGSPGSSSSAARPASAARRSPASTCRPRSVLFDKHGKLDQIRAEGEAGRHARAARRRDPGDPAAAARRCGPARRRRRRTRSDTKSFLSFLQNFLLAFGGIALFVGAFVIANSLSITIAQRTREFATLRTLGASRRQVLRLDPRRGARRWASLASVVGILLGLGLAKGLFKLFDAVGFTLPNNGLVARDADDRRRAARRRPRHAAREPAPGAPGDARAADRGRARGRDAAAGSRFARYRTPGAIAAHGRSASPRSPTACSAAGLGTTQILVFMGVGTLLIFFGVALFSARLVAAARARARLAGGEDRRSAPASLARDNSRAEPAAHGLDRVGADDRPRARHARRRARRRDHARRFRGAVDELWVSGYAITAQNNFSPIPIAAGDAAAKTPGVEAIANVRAGDARVFGKTIQATARQPGGGRDLPPRLERRLRQRARRRSARTARSSTRTTRRSTT